MRFSLTRRLFFLAAVALLPGLAILTYDEYALRRTRTSEITELALRNAQQAGAELQRVFDAFASVLVAVSASQAVRTFDALHCSSYLAAVKTGLKFVGNIAAVDTAGNIRCNSADPVTGNVADRSYFKAALASGEFVIGEYIEGRGSGRQHLPTAAPLKDETGAIIGIVVASLDLDWLQARIQERGLAHGAALTIADRNGVIIARDPLPERFIGTRIPDPFLALVNADQPGTMEVKSQDGTERIIGYIPARLPPVGLYVSSGISKEEAFGAIDRSARFAAALIALGAIVSLASAWLIGHSFIQRPVSSILQAMSRWREGQAGARTGMAPEAGEIEAIGAELDLLMDELDRRQKDRTAAEHQRELIASEMAHRLKNTLMVVQAIAWQTFRGLPDGAKSVDSFNSRITALANAHSVLLTKGSRQDSDFRTAVEEILRPHQAGDERRFNLEGPQVRVSAPVVLALSLVLHELSTNAVKYGALSNDRGRVDISWTARHEAHGDRLVVTWTESGGPPIEGPPAQTGFGSSLIKRAFPPQFAASVETFYEPAGLKCVVDFLLGPSSIDRAPAGSGAALDIV